MFKERKFILFFWILQVLSQILKKTPILLTSGINTEEEINLTQLFQCACGCLGFPENGPVKYACTFLAQFISTSRDHPPLNSIVDRHGEVLFMNTMQCIGGNDLTLF